MPGAEKLKEKIVAEAKAYAEKVLAEAEQRAAAAIAKGEAEGESRKKALLEQGKIQAEEQIKRARTIAGLEARKAILAAKEELIEDTFHQALERLQDLEQQEWEKVLFPLLLSAVPEKGGELLMSPRDRERLSAAFLDKVKKALRQQGKKGELTLAGETREIMGGFILRAGEVEINCSFDALLRMQRDQLEPQVAAMLFKE